MPFGHAAATGVDNTSRTNNDATTATVVNNDNGNVADIASMDIASNIVIKQEDSEREKGKASFI